MPPFPQRCPRGASERACSNRATPAGGAPTGPLRPPPAAPLRLLTPPPLFLPPRRAAQIGGGGGGGGGAADEEKITLVSEEGEELVIPRSLAQMSSLVSTMLGDDGSEDKKIPLQQIKGPVLVKVVEFMKRHVVNKLPEIEKPLKSADLSALQPPLDQWDIDFVTCDPVRGGRPFSP